MSDFNYQEYLKNNPLTKEEVKEQLLTESQEIQNEEVAEVEETVTEEFSEFKSYDDIVGGIHVRLGALEDYVQENEPDAMDDLQRIIAMFNTFDEDMTYYSGKESSSMNEEEIEEGEEVEEVSSSKMKVSELKAKIKEDIIALLAEQDEEEDVEVEDEVEIEDTIEEPALDAADSQEGLTADEKEIQDSLKVAYDNAVAIGDTKLADQIGNSITFFTRTHVVER